MVSVSLPPYGNRYGRIWTSYLIHRHLHTWMPSPHRTPSPWTQLRLSFSSFCQEPASWMEESQRESLWRCPDPLVTSFPGRLPCHLPLAFHKFLIIHHSALCHSTHRTLRWCVWPPCTRCNPDITQVNNISQIACVGQSVVMFP